MFLSNKCPVIILGLLNLSYSPGITLLKEVVTARLEVFASSLILAMTMFAAEDVWRKILAFCYFQISHEMSMMREAIAFLSFPLWSATLVHQSLKDSSLPQSSRVKLWMPHQARISFQIIVMWLARTLYISLLRLSMCVSVIQKANLHTKSKAQRRVAEGNISFHKRIYIVFNITQLT